MVEYNLIRVHWASANIYSNQSIPGTSYPPILVLHHQGPQSRIHPRCILEMTLHGHIWWRRFSWTYVANGAVQATFGFVVDDEYQCVCVALTVATSSTTSTETVLGAVATYAAVLVVFVRTSSSVSKT